MKLGRDKVTSEHKLGMNKTRSNKIKFGPDEIQSVQISLVPD